MNNEQLLQRFYTSFSKRNAIQMLECYHKNIVFEDPAFGKLEGERACKMWEMLLSNAKSNTKISFSNIKSNEENGYADWRAEYVFEKRKVINIIHAEFVFRDSKIIKHIDSFDLWNWSKQALGLPGYLLGWSSFMKNKIRSNTNHKLNRYIESSKNHS